MFSRGAGGNKMVEIVTAANRILYRDELEAMHKFRYDVAVGEMGWTLPDAKNGYDIDAYDTANTVYFLDISEDGRLIASSRINPTTGPHLLIDVFPDFVDGNFPIGPEIWEHSRYLVTRKGTTQEEFVKARARVLIAVNEFALANNIKTLSVLTYQKHYQTAAYLSRTRPLGAPRFYPEDDEYYIAMTCEVSSEGLNKARALMNMHSQVGRLSMPLSLHGQIPTPQFTPPHFKEKCDA